MVHFLIRVFMGVALSPWTQAHAADGGETEIKLTPEQRLICQRHRTTTGISDCVRDFLATNAQEAREAEKAASDKGLQLRRQREIAAAQPDNPDLCAFNTYKVTCKDANDEAVKLYRASSSVASEPVAAKLYEDAIVVCRRTCEEAVGTLKTARHCRVHNRFAEMQRQLDQLIESCSNPATIGVENKDGAQAPQNVEARKELVEGARADETTTSSFHTERCVAQTGGISYCQASYNTGAGPSTRYFYRDSYGGSYETYEGATSDQSEARITLPQEVQPPVPAERIQRDPIVPQEPIAQREVVEQPKEVEPEERATNGGSNAGATTGSTNGSTTSGTNAGEPTVARATNGGSNGGTGGGSSGGSSGGMGGGMGGGTSGSSPFIATPFPSDASPSGSYTGSEISSGSSGGGGGFGGGLGGGSSSGGSGGGSRNRPGSTSGSGSVEAAALVATAGGGTSGGGMMTPASSRMGAGSGGGRSGTSGGSGAGELPGAAFGSQFYNRAQGGPAGLAAKKAAANAAKRKKIVRKGSKLNQCDGNVQCLLVAAGVSKEKFRKVRIRGTGDRDIASVQSTKWPNDVGRGLHDVLSHMSTYYNQIQLDHEGLIENNE